MIPVWHDDMFTSGRENNDSCLTATTAPPYYARLRRPSARATCCGDGGRRRNEDAAAVRSADVLSRWFVRVGYPRGTLCRKLGHPSRRVCLGVESPSSTRCPSLGASAFTPRCRSALGRPPGHWGDCRSRGGLIGTGRDLGRAAARRHTAPGGTSSGY